eukprot:Gb_19940 [translate_table: standard]
MLRLIITFYLLFPNAQAEAAIWSCCIKQYIDNIGQWKRMKSYNAWASVVCGSTHNMEPAVRAVQAAVGRHSSHCNGDANELAERAFNVWRIANTAHSWLGSVLQTQTQTQAPPSTDRRRITASGYSTAMPLRDNSSPLAMTLSCWGPT